MSPSSPKLRSAEVIPSLAEADARRLRGLPPSWEERVEESAIDALAKRAKAIAAALKARGRRPEAVELGRSIALLERVAELHDHALRVETLAQLYRALLALAGPGASTAEDAALDEARAWVQAGALPTDDGSRHGPAFRATAALRSRAFRLVEALVARRARTLGS